jgi:hypothetical protein
LKSFLGALILKDKMWGIDPVDLWTAVALVVGYSLPFFALEIEFKLQELKRRATEREIQKAILRRFTGHD